MSPVAVNPPGTQHRAKKDAVEGAKRRRASTRWPSLPFVGNWFYFSSCQLSKCRASTSRDATILWESPGLWAGRPACASDSVHYVSWVHLSRPGSPHREMGILSQPQGLVRPTHKRLYLGDIVVILLESSLRIKYRQYIGFLPSRNITPALFLSSVSYFHLQSFPFLTWMVGLFYRSFYRIRTYVYLVHGHVPKSAIT